MVKPVAFRTDVLETRTRRDTRTVPFGWTGTRAELEAGMRAADAVYAAVLRKKRCRKDAQRTEERRKDAERKAWVERWFNENVRDHTNTPVRELERSKLDAWSQRVLGTSP